ncbi:MAG: hypothetical protein HY659_00035 [Rhizobiales bacterium]|nr:hypothetical protein [Hyphomicrobiales bacterium]
MRIVAVVVLASLAGACATGDAGVTAAAAPEKPDTGKWKFERRIDPITGATATTAWLEISTYEFLKGNYEGDLQLMCFKNQPIVRLAFNLKVGSDKTGSIAYRFDDNPGREIKARFFAKPRIIVIEDKAEVARFAGELAAAEVLHLRVTALTKRGFAAKFPVHGAPHAIKAAYAECPLPADPPHKRAGA